MSSLETAGLDGAGESWPRPVSPDAWLQQLTDDEFEALNRRWFLERGEPYLPDALERGSAQR
jgi:hypothetical protein